MTFLTCQKLISIDMDGKNMVEKQKFESQNNTSYTYIIYINTSYTSNQFVWSLYIKSVFLISKWLVKKLGFQKLRGLLGSDKQRKVFGIFSWTNLSFISCSKVLNTPGLGPLCRHDFTQSFLFALGLFSTTPRAISILTINCQFFVFWIHVKKKRFSSCINIYLFLSME